MSEMLSTASMIGILVWVVPVYADVAPSTAIESSSSTFSHPKYYNNGKGIGITNYAGGECQDDENMPTQTSFLLATTMLDTKSVCLTSTTTAAADPTTAKAEQRHEKDTLLTYTKITFDCTAIAAVMKTYDYDCVDSTCTSCGSNTTATTTVQVWDDWLSYTPAPDHCYRQILIESGDVESWKLEDDHQHVNSSSYQDWKVYLQTIIQNSCISEFIVVGMDAENTTTTSGSTTIVSEAEDVGGNIATTMVDEEDGNCHDNLEYNYKDGKTCSWVRHDVSNRCVLHARDRTDPTKLIRNFCPVTCGACNTGVSDDSEDVVPAAAVADDLMIEDDWSVAAFNDIIDDIIDKVDADNSVTSSDNVPTDAKEPEYSVTTNDNDKQESEEAVVNGNNKSRNLKNTIGVIGGSIIGSILLACIIGGSVAYWKFGTMFCWRHNNQKKLSTMVEGPPRGFDFSTISDTDGDSHNRQEDDTDQCSC